MWERERKRDKYQISEIDKVITNRCCICLFLFRTARQTSTTNIHLKHKHTFKWTEYWCDCYAAHVFSRYMYISRRQLFHFVSRKVLLHEHENRRTAAPTESPTTNSKRSKSALHICLLLFVGFCCTVRCNGSYCIFYIIPLHTDICTAWFIYFHFDFHIFNWLTSTKSD